MRAIPRLLVAAALIASAACGATTRSGSVATPASTAVLTGATVSFRSLDDGKDDQSTLTVELVRRSEQLAAQLRVVDVEFNDNSQTTPMSIPVIGTLHAGDIDDANVRLRMNAHGDDEWTFDMHLTLTFSDNTQRTFSWLRQELDDDHPEKTLSLSSGRVR